MVFSFLCFPSLDRKSVSDGLAIHWRSNTNCMTTSLNDESSYDLNTIRLKLIIKHNYFPFNK